VGTILGQVRECWRYPVKSMQGERVEALAVGGTGIEGDRAHAVIDVSSGRILTAKTVKELLFARVDGGAVQLPDGTEVALDDPGASGALSAWLGREVRLTTPVAGEERAFQMTFDPPNDAADLVDIPAPVGSFLDLAAVHIVTTATLEGCRDKRPELDWDVRRFRPNLVIEIDGPPFAENDWGGQALRVGDAVELDVIGPTVRCAMPLRAQPGLEREAGLFHAMCELNTRFANHLGVYANTRNPGRVATGDAVTLVDEN
jgi:uncharacterized protein YcbX